MTQDIPMKNIEYTDGTPSREWEDVPAAAEMPEEIKRLITKYTRNDRNNIDRFLGCAEQCGFKLQRTDLHTDTVERLDAAEKVIDVMKVALTLAQKGLEMRGGGYDEWVIADDALKALFEYEGRKA